MNYYINTKTGQIINMTESAFMLLPVSQRELFKLVTNQSIKVPYEYNKGQESLHFEHPGGNERDSGEIRSDGDSRDIATTSGEVKTTNPTRVRGRRRKQS